METRVAVNMLGEVLDAAEIFLKGATEASRALSVVLARLERGYRLRPDEIVKLKKGCTAVDAMTASARETFDRVRRDLSIIGGPARV